MNIDVKPRLQPRLGQIESRKASAIGGDIRVGLIKAPFHQIKPGVHLDLLLRRQRRPPEPAREPILINHQIDRIRIQAPGRGTQPPDALTECFCGIRLSHGTLMLDHLADVSKVRMICEAAIPYRLPVRTR